MLGVPLILVLGHDACGAVDATIKSLKDNTTLPGHLPSLVTALAPAVKAVSGKGGDTLDNAIRQNVIDNVAKLKFGDADPVGRGRAEQAQGGRRHLPAEGRQGRYGGVERRKRAGFGAKSPPKSGPFSLRIAENPAI